MASTAPLDAASLELARSLPIESIPERLRCVTCDKLAFHAMKLPCCDNNICGDCYSTLNTTECPLCTHSPFSADMCTPAKSLQTTTKVFLKNELKKRGADTKSSAKAATETPTLQAAESTDTATPALATPSAPADGESAPAGNAQGSQEPAAVSADDQAAAPAAQAQDESMNGGADEENADADQDDEEDDDDDVVITTERPPTEEKQQEGEGNEQYDAQNEEQGDASEQNMQMDQQQQGFGFDQNMNGFGNGNFGNMNMNMNGFNPMMGMPGFGMNMPNMMGMMDPSMMFNGNFGGMGDMSAMMGMGMNGMGGGMNGMGDFNGMGGPGFFPNGNYMQQSNYGNAHRQNFYNDRGYGRGYGRGFGRGRGNYGRGRGGWGYQQQQHHQYGQNQLGGPQQSGANTMDVANHRRASPSYEAGQGADDTPATSGDHQPKTDTNADPDAMDTNTVENTNAADESTNDGNTAPSQEPQDPNGTGNPAEGSGDGQFYSAMQGAQDFDDGMQGQHFGYGNDFAGRGGFRGRGGFARGSDVTELTPAPAPPINAPTGPKAMRQGLPNTGWASRAMTSKPTPTPAPEVKAPSLSVEPSGRDDRMQDDYRNGDHGRSPTPDDYSRRNSRGKDYDYEYESDETYARRKERERRKRKEREERYEDDRDRDEKSSKKYRSRSESRTDDSSRRRHRDKDEEHRSSRSHHDRSKERHRRHHRSRSPAKDGEDEYSRRKSKGDRDAERDDDHHSRRSRKHSRREDDYEEDRKDRSHRSSKHERRDEREPEREPRPRTIIEPPSDELGFKIKGSRSAKMAPPLSRDRRGSNQDSNTPTSSSDPYAEERARATQHRVLKEAMRRQSSSTLGKRGRDGKDEGFDAPTGPKGDRNRVKKGRKERRIGYKYEDEVGEEDERDAGRWR